MLSRDVFLWKPRPEIPFPSPKDENVPFGCCLKQTEPKNYKIFTKPYRWLNHFVLLNISFYQASGTHHTFSLKKIYQYTTAMIFRKKKLSFSSNRKRFNKTDFLVGMKNLAIFFPSQWIFGTFYIFFCNNRNQQIATQAFHVEHNGRDGN